MVSELLRLTLLASSVLAATAQLNFVSGNVPSITSSEQVVSGTISLKGDLNPENVGKLNLAAQNAIAALCTGSAVVVGAQLQLRGDASGRRTMDITFDALPPRFGGGDCSMILNQAAVGKEVGPFNGDEPHFRFLMRSSLEVTAPSWDISAWTIKLWRITCDVKTVKMYSGIVQWKDPILDCSDYKPGWEIYTEASLTEAATPGEEGGAVTGNDDFLKNLDDSCNLGGSACLCDSMSANCAWRAHSSGGFRCRTRASGDVAPAVTCEECSFMEGCPALCSSARSACGCAAMAAATACRWEPDNTGVSAGQCVSAGSAGANDVSCTFCWMQDKCDDLRPKVSSYKPVANTLLAKSGADAVVEVTFDTALGPLSANQGTVSLVCAEGAVAPREAQAGTETFFMEADAMVLTTDRTLELDMSTVKVAEESMCTVLLSEGAVSSKTDGLPVIPDAFGSYVIKMPDTVPPGALVFSPANGAIAVPLATATASVSFSEKLKAGHTFRAELTQLALVGTPSGDPVSIPLESVLGKTLKLRLQGLLKPGRLYQITIGAGSVLDFANLPFTGVEDGQWTFRVEGEDDSNVVVVEADEWSLVGPRFIATTTGAAVLCACFIAFASWKAYKMSSSTSSVAPEPTDDSDTAAAPPEKNPTQAMQDEDDDEQEHAKKRFSFMDDDETIEDRLHTTKVHGTSPRPSQNRGSSRSPSPAPSQKRGSSRSPSPVPRNESPNKQKRQSSRSPSPDGHHGSSVSHHRSLHSSHSHHRSSHGSQQSSQLHVPDGSSHHHHDHHHHGRHHSGHHSGHPHGHPASHSEGHSRPSPRPSPRQSPRQSPQPSQLKAPPGDWEGKLGLDGFEQ